MTFESLRNGLQQWRRKRVQRAKFHLGKVNDTNARECLIFKTFGESCQMVLSFLCTCPCLQRRCSGSKNELCLRDARECLCSFPCVVSRCLLVFIGPLMLFVDHDQSQIWKRRKECAAGTDHERNFPTLDALPEGTPHGRSKTTVHDCNGTWIKQFLKTFNAVFGKKNFRHEENRLFSGSYCICDERCIDFCFSASCNTEEE